MINEDGSFTEFELCCLLAMFEDSCKHKDAYHEHKDEFPKHCCRIEDSNFNWQDCEDCPLYAFRWKVPGTRISRDLCFAIWHEDVLDELKFDLGKK